MIVGQMALRSREKGKALSSQTEFLMCKLKISAVKWGKTQANVLVLTTSLNRIRQFIGCV